MAYHRGSSLVVQREYSYDALGRPTARNTTSPLAIQKDGTWRTYGLDLTKNVC